MRTLLVLATLCLLTAPAVAAEPPTPEEVREHVADCATMTTYPYENPLEIVPALVQFTLCVADQ